MPVPTAISSLSQTAASNSPPGTESPTSADDYLRQYSAFIAMLRDGIGFTDPVQLASAATTSIGAQNSLFVEITGTTTITSFGSTYEGPRFLRFTGALTLTHNATTLNLPGAANITTAAGDTCIAIPNYAGNGWNVVQFQRAGFGLSVAADSAAARAVLGLPSASAPVVHLNTANGYGSTATKVRRFTNTVLSQGSDITYSDSAADGATFTINTSGVYAISWSDNFNGTEVIGLSLDNANGATGVRALAISSVLAHAITPSTNGEGMVGVTRYLPVASVIRPHTNGGTASGTGTAAVFIIQRLA